MKDRKSNKTEALLEFRDVRKSFPGVKALDSVSFKVKGGSVHALMGENGAGKSTLMKCLFGVYKKDGGAIYLDGKEINFQNSREALDGGVAMVHQELNQALKLTVMDNVWLGRFPTLYKWLPFINKKACYEKTKEIFSELDIDTDPEEKMELLSVSKRQMVEIAKAVSYDSKVIVFDEPTSSLNEREAERLFGIIKKLRDDGRAIIYISHKMDEILRISDEITVMRDGKHIATRSASDITTDEIIKLMVGRELVDRYPKRKGKSGDELLSVSALSGRHTHLNDVSFKLLRGEILGIAGLDGAGRTELVETVFGLRERDGGEITLEGKRISIKSPDDAKRHGLALITEERRESGIFGILSVLENATAASLRKYRIGPLLSNKKRLSATRWCIRTMKVKTPSEKTKISTLSGGNQQKIILGRWLLNKPIILMLDEPTRGIDVGAKYEIYKLICELADKGHGVIIVSSEMGELIGLSDRIIVMSGGRVAGELNKADFSQEKIMRLAGKFA